MQTLLAKSTKPYAVQSLIAYMEQEYYAPVEWLCRRVKDYITEIHGGDSEQTASLYTALSKKLIEDAATYVELRRVWLRSYLDEGTKRCHHSNSRSNHIEETK